MAEIILIPKQLRMEWTDVLALDAGISHAAFRVACVIGSHFNSTTGETFVTQDTVARVMGVSSRTVWSAIRELEECGYIIVRRRELGVRVSDGRRVNGGKGAANVYLPAFERSQVAATSRGLKLATHCDLVWSQRSQVAATSNGSKVAMDCELSGSQRSQNPASKVAMGCDPTLKTNSKNARASALALRLGSPAQLLHKRLGSEKFESWFAKVELVVPGPPVATLRAPSRFIRDYIVQHFDEMVLSCWKATSPTIERVEIIYGTVAEGGAS
ncbi:helix-turn-helix domain-containing protein [Nitrobacter sp.]|uniref:helix-turn-helix domain-containing protein n=1 Tax=Nitrobacter sp. TaxID=29420 RepID=UPI003F653758